MNTIFLSTMFAILSATFSSAVFAATPAMGSTSYIAAGAQPLQVTCTSRIWASGDPAPSTFPEPKQFALKYKFAGDGSFMNLGGTAQILVHAGDVIAAITRGVNSPHELVLEIYDEPGLAAKTGLAEIASKADLNLFTFKSRRTYMAGESSVAFGGTIVDQTLQVNCSL